MGLNRRFIKRKNNKKPFDIKVITEDDISGLQEGTSKKSTLKLYRESFSQRFNIKKLIHHFIWLFKGVQVIAIVGKSGTGKSFRAKLVSHKYNIDIIIDDGLVIRDNKIIAGKSAKKESSKIAAIKTALFLESDHLDEVIRVLERENFKRVLVVATSEKMAQKICDRLGLPYPKKIIRIEDIATEEEIKRARMAREIEGKHVIPVPAVEVKANYPNIFFKSIKILLEKKFLRSRNQRVYEKSIVRPPFGERGVITVSDRAVSQMVYQCVKDFNESLNVEKVIVKRQKYGYELEIILNVPYGISIGSMMEELQNYIVDNMEKFAGLSITRVDISVNSIRKG